MSGPKVTDVWAVGSAYERYIGRWSGLVAREFVSGLRAEPDGRWLDVGCGTGVLTRTILELASPKAVVGIDPSSGFLEHARAMTTDPRASFQTAAAGDLPVGDHDVDRVVSGLVLNFVPDPDQALAEMVRVTREGGTVAAYVWDYAGEMQLLRHFWDAAASLDPAAAELDEGRRRFSLCEPDALRRLFEQAGLREVKTRSIDVPTAFAGFDDYWLPFLGGQGPAPSYVTTLDDGQRDALRERVRASLPMEPDGTIALIARAWAVSGGA